jgi:excinuclease ABC subunit C
VAKKADREGTSPPSIEEKLSTVPRRPGVYVFKGPKEKVLYVGKAKDLRSRLGSYFQRSASLDVRKSAMVGKVRDFNYIVTGNELEAFALEANLIKQYKPRFNIILRDDKNYPYLKLTVNEQWPRLEVVRRIKDDGAMYFGPYVPAGAMWETLAFIRRNFGLRPCRYRLDKPMRPCIDYQMGRCPAPCAGLISRQEYLHAVDEVLLFLKGRRKRLLEELERKMKRFSGEMRYEEAAGLRDRAVALRKSMQSQKVIAPELGDVDVAGFHAGSHDAVFQVFFIRGGTMIGARDFYLRDVGGIAPAELLHSFMVMFYSKDIIPPREIIVGARPEDPDNLVAWLRQSRAPAGREGKAARKKKRNGGALKITVPRRGRKRELLKMAEENARLLYDGRKSSGSAAALGELGSRLGLKSPPESIGAFDVSNIAGSEPVGAFIYWSGGEFRKDRYRRLRIKTVAGIDDYAMMRETVSRVLGDVETPDLIVIDGGKGHLEAALGAVETLEVKAEVVALAKKPDRLFTSRSGEPLGLEGRSPSSLLLRRIRDEAHRFAIGYHKKLRDRRTVSSPLEGVPGIGAKRRLALLRHFGSLDAVRKAPVEELARVPGMNRKAAQAVRQAMGTHGAL